MASSLRFSLPSKSLSTPSIFHLKAARNQATVSLFDGIPSRAPLANPLRYLYHTTTIRSHFGLKNTILSHIMWLLDKTNVSVLCLQSILVWHWIITCLMILLAFWFFLNFQDCFADEGKEAWDCRPCIRISERANSPMGLSCFYWVRFS